MARDTEQLRVEIEHTRDRMSDTLGQLGERLNPRRIKQRVKNNIREATIGRVENMARQAADRVNDSRNGLLNTIRDNPIPAAMVGIGLGWLLFNGRRERDTGRLEARHHEDIGEFTGTGYVGDVSAATPRLKQDDAAGGPGASISHDRETGVRERVSEVAHRAEERVSDVSHRVEDSFQRSLQDQPLAVGAVALAVGLAAGFAIPETRRESQLMGSARDRLMERARETASDAKERVQQVAERVIDERSSPATESNGANTESAMTS
ncbi:MAG: DUF3618 domain-containing protein [Gemmatimonadota bacterium]